jgi:hypothetical protein
MGCLLDVFQAEIGRRVSHWVFEKVDLDHYQNGKA